ncbi:hypothetical protein CRENBAI_009892, partial [Crenichthys baileyi]
MMHQKQVPAVAHKSSACITDLNDILNLNRRVQFMVLATQGMDSYNEIHQMHEAQYAAARTERPFFLLFPACLSVSTFRAPQEFSHPFKPCVLSQRFPTGVR